MKKWLALIVVILLALAGWLAAGPFITVNAIRTAVQQQDATKLSQQVDFPALRTSLKQQVDDYVGRRAGTDAQASVLGSVALQLASGATDGLVDAMATPAGLAAVMEGRNFWDRLTGRRADSGDSYATAPPRDPLEGAKYRFESPSRFTATIANDDGDPLVLVLTRQGLAWKVTDVRLPLNAGDAPSPQG